jgi:hypothetical protein
MAKGTTVTHGQTKPVRIEVGTGQENTEISKEDTERLKEDTGPHKEARVEDDNRSRDRTIRKIMPIERTAETVETEKIQAAIGL